MIRPDDLRCLLRIHPKCRGDLLLMPLHLGLNGKDCGSPENVTQALLQQLGKLGVVSLVEGGGMREWQ